MAVKDFATKSKQNMFALYVSTKQAYITFVYYFVVDTLKLYVSQQRCGKGVVRFMHKNHLVIVWKRSYFDLKHLHLVAQKLLEKKGRVS